MFKMAEDVESLLRLNITWLERYALARLLISACCYAGIYRCVTEDASDERSPFFIVKPDQSFRLPEKPRKIQKDVPFPRWTTLYDDLGNRLVEACKPCPPEEAFKPRIPQGENEFVPYLEAVHKLEAVPYRINKHFLRLVVSLDEPDKSDKDAKYRTVKKEYPHEARDRKALDKRAKELDVPRLEKGYKKDTKIREKDEKRDERRKKEKKKPLPRSEGYVLTEEEQQSLRDYRGDRSDLKRTVQSYKDRRRNFEDAVATAKDLSGHRFFHRASVDYRGRVYLSSEFSYQGSDFCRAVIEFADGVPLTKSGWQWLYNHATNHKGKSDSFAVKVEEHEKIAAETTDIGLDPMGKFEEWSSADEPYCYLRACLEITSGSAAVIKVMEKQNPKLLEEAKPKEKKWLRALLSWSREIKVDKDGTLLSHLPIEMDQSNSAYQHIGCLMDDKKLRRWSNLEGDEYHDLYTEIGNLLNRNDIKKKERRKIIKEVAKKWGYGATLGTCAETLGELRADEPEKYPHLHSLTYSQLFALTTEVVQLLDRECDSARRFFDDVYQIVDNVRDNGQVDYIAWRTPMGFEMFEKKVREKRDQRDIWSGDKDIYPVVYRPKGIAWHKMKTSAPPNVVHSLDACLLHGTLWAGRFWGDKDEEGRVYVIAGNEDGSDYIPYPVITIQDAFACHASYCEDLNQKLRDNLKALYRDFDPFQAFRDQTEGGEFDPIQRPENWVNPGENAFS